MSSKQLLSMIKRRRMLLNFLLNILSPTNSIIVRLSQNLDILIVKYQKSQVKTVNVNKTVNYKCAA